MKYRMYWGLAILIILLIGVSVFLLTRPTETDPEIVYQPPTPAEQAEVKRKIQEKIDKAKKDLPPVAEVEVDRPKVEIEKPQAEEQPVPVPRNSGAGVIPNYGLVELENPILGTPILLRTTNVPGIDIDWVSLSPEELADTIAKLERGEISAPDGYRYLKTVPDSSGELKFDENGYPIIHKNGEYTIAVAWSMRFRPPPDVWEEYHDLAAQRNLLERDVDDSPEIRALESQMAEMERTYAGPLPSGFFLSGASPVGDTGPESRADRMSDHIRAELYRKIGFGHLLTIPQ